MGQRPPNRNRRHSPKPWPLTVKQVAAEECVSVYIVRDWIRNGLLHRKRPGKRGHITLRIEDVHEWRAANGRTESSSKPQPSKGKPRDDSGAGGVATSEADDESGDEDLDSSLSVLLTKARLAKELQLGEKHRISNEKARGLLLDQGDVERRWLERCQYVGSSLVAFAQRVTPLLVNKKSRQITKILDAATRDILQEYSRSWPA